MRAGSENAGNSQGKRVFLVTMVLLYDLRNLILFERDIKMPFQLIGVRVMLTIT